jgi:hypothetical protein
VSKDFFNLSSLSSLQLNQRFLQTLPLSQLPVRFGITTLIVFQTVSKSSFEFLNSLRHQPESMTCKPLPLSQHPVRSGMTTLVAPHSGVKRVFSNSSNHPAASPEASD